MGSRTHWLPYLALGAVCIFWGTTYLAIRVALESFSPLVLMTLRFTTSGALLLGWAWWRGLAFPRGWEWGRTALVGLMLLGVANLCLTMSETLIPSSLAALILTTAPFWLVGMEALVPGGDRLTWPVAGGLLIGLAGAALLLVPEDAASLSAATWEGFALLQVANLFWNGGSVLQRRWKSATHPMLTGAIQQLTVGLACGVAALAVPQPEPRWSWAGAGGILWLVTFGSIVAYSAYIYAIQTLPVSLVSIYTYINPIVAVGLGWLFYREPFGLREGAAMLVIFMGVAVVKRFSGRSSG